MVHNTKRRRSVRIPGRLRPRSLKHWRPPQLACTRRRMDTQEDSVQGAPLTRFVAKQYQGVAVYDTADTVYEPLAVFIGASGAEQARRILFDGNRNHPCDTYL